MKTKFISVLGYKITNNTGKVSSTMLLDVNSITLILGTIQLIVNGKLIPLYNVYNNSGLMGTTDLNGVTLLLEHVKGENRIKTYTVTNGVSRINETMFVNYSTITKMIPINMWSGQKLYQCTTSDNFVLFTTDESGYLIISGYSPLKEIQQCVTNITLTVDLGENIVEDGLTYSLIFDTYSKYNGCYTINGNSLDNIFDTISVVSKPLNCSDCGKTQF